MESTRPLASAGGFRNGLGESNSTRRFSRRAHRGISVFMNGGLSATLMSIAVIAIFLLLVGGMRLVRLGQTLKGVLMLVMAVVLLGNVLVWTLP